jgi:hypothetical protein
MDTDALWRAVYNAFDPQQSPWEEEAARFYVERHDRPLARLMLELTDSIRPLKAIVPGHRGAGKSWALADLARHLADQFFIVWLDVERSTDIFNVNHLEILFLMGVAAFWAAEQAGLYPDRARLEELVESLETLVQEQTDARDFRVDLDKVLEGVIAVGLGVAATGAAPVGVAVAGAAALLRTVPFSLGVSAETVRRLEVKPHIAEVVRRLNGLLDDVRHTTQRPILMLVDGLDKIETEQARAVFAESLVLREPGCHIVYTVPILLYYSPDLHSARQLFIPYEFPNVRLYRQRQPQARDGAGYALMRQVVETRLRALDVAPRDVITLEALDRLIEMSGGVMRELVGLVRDATLQVRLVGQERIDEAIANQAVYRLRRQYAAGLSEPYYTELAEVHKTGRRTDSKICDKLLQNLYILGYANEELWYAVHPNVKPLIEGVE